jgi:hypothetical protein
LACAIREVRETLKNWTRNIRTFNMFFPNR